MTQSYPLDLPERVTQFEEGCGSCDAAAAHFGVSIPFGGEDDGDVSRNA